MNNPSPGNQLRLLPWLYAAGAVFWLMAATYYGAFLAAPGGRDQLRQNLIDRGMTTDLDFAVLAGVGTVIGLALVAAILHGAAYYGLRAFRAWGWVVAVFISALWSCVLIGIPILMLLLRRPVRQAYGIS